VEKLRPVEYEVAVERRYEPQEHLRTPLVEVAGRVVRRERRAVGRQHDAVLRGRTAGKPRVEFLLRNVAAGRGRITRRQAYLLCGGYRGGLLRFDVSHRDTACEYTARHQGKHRSFLHESFLPYWCDCGFP